MTPADLQEYLLGKRGATESQPFGPEVLVYKVGGKMFATLTLDEQDHMGRANLKCAPDRALDVRDQYDAITAGYHMNKRHWNTLKLDGSIPIPVIHELVDHSWKLVVDSLPKKDQLAFLSSQ